jgi:hypothetical protein
MILPKNFLLLHCRFTVFTSEALRPVVYFLIFREKRGLTGQC